MNDMYLLSASFQEHVWSDWGQVFLKTVRGTFSFYYVFCFWLGFLQGRFGTWMKEVLYLNIRVYGSCFYVRVLRTLSMRTTILTGVMVP